MIGLKMAWVCGEMKEGSGLFSCWLEELGWRGHFLTAKQKECLMVWTHKFEMSIRLGGAGRWREEVQWKFDMRLEFRIGM